jgi:predicted ribonuclease YlaK
MSKKHIAVDANVLLHYTFFTDIDWTSIIGASAVELIIPYTVISTLDDKKFDSSDSAVKSRARSVTRTFQKIVKRACRSDQKLLFVS